MTDWQPIDTAPKDGAEVIGFHLTVYGQNSISSYGPWTMRFYDGKWIPSWDGYHVIESEGDFGTDYRDLPLQPTHWMPLPAPPTPPQEQT